MAASIDHQALDALIASLRRFNGLDRKMQVSTILTLLEIAAADAKGEPLTVRDVEARVGLLSGTSTRNVRYWEEGYQGVTGRHGLVLMEIDPGDGRRRLLRLTPRGKEFISSLTSIS